MPGKFTVVGVGPGDPELLTFKAARILREVQCIFVPKGREEGASLALSIVQKALAIDNKEIVELHFPMQKTRNSKVSGVRSEENNAVNTTEELKAKWNAAVDSILERLEAGLDAAFITIGDPGIYSTFFYLYERLIGRMPSIRIEIVPGISSINASAARAGISLGLGDEKIAVLPANYPDSLEETLERFDTVVLMKVNKAFDAIKKALDGKRLAEKAVFVSRAGMEDERVIRNIRDVREEDLNYFSLVIVRKR